MPLPFTRQELKALVLIAGTGLVGLTVPLVMRVGPSLPGASAETVNLNTASAAELEALPGIGPVTAQRIIADRRRHGRFVRVEDLTRVKGIAKQTIPRLKPRVRLE